jgi:hypothetical protein
MKSLIVWYITPFSPEDINSLQCCSSATAYLEWYKGEWGRKGEKNDV